MNRYLVCDAGGTKGDFLLFDSSGTMLAHHHTGGGNALFLNPDAATETVVTGIHACLAMAGLQLSALNEIALFIPGFARCMEALRHQLPDAAITLHSDTENAFYGALGCGHGLVVLAGTGSFAFGRDRHGTTASVGGWGPLIGDHGSGYHLGILALQEVTRRWDEGLPCGMLEQLLLSYVGVKAVPELRSAIYRAEFDRRRIAGLCPVVAEAAKSGDDTALSVLRQGAASLCDLAVTAAARLDREGLALSLTGGVTRMGALIVQPFCDELSLRLPQLHYLAPKYPPVIGGMLYLLEQREGCDITLPKFTNELDKGVERYVNG